MKTIKEKVLKAVSKQGTITRKDLYFIIFKAQGKKITKATKYKSGYYGTNIQDWVRDGLLVQPKGGGYKIGKIGKQFLEDPKHTRLLIRLKKSEIKVKNLLNGYTLVRNELRAANRKLGDIIHVVNR